MELIDEEKFVHVYRASISSIHEAEVELSTGAKISSDAIVFCTGWDIGCDSLFDPSEGGELGVSVPLDSLSEEYISHWQNLDAAAEKYVLESFPLLRTAPKIGTARSSPPIPYRCFRTIVPNSLAAKHDRSLIYLGMLGNSQVPSHAEVSSLWGVAYLEDLLLDGSCDGLLGDEEGMDNDVANMTMFMAKRYPDKYHPLAHVEVQSHLDITMRDLGLRTDRKRVEREAEEGLL
jgi:dimethylaniline monooxygenase (N-oxide forming)